MEAFRLQFSLGNVKEKWRKWRQDLENYLLATEKDDRTDKIKIAILLNLFGSEGLEIYNTFKFEELAKNSLSILKFEEYCSPRQNVVYLKTLASTCEFAEQENGLIRDRIVLGIKDRGLQERLLRENNLNIEKAIEIVWAAEAKREQIRNMKCDTATINFVKENQNKPETQGDWKYTRIYNPQRRLREGCRTDSSPAYLPNHQRIRSHLNPLLPKSPGLQKQTIVSSTALLTTTTIITATFLPSNQEAPSSHRRQHPRKLKLFTIWGGGLIYNPVAKDTQRILAVEEWLSIHFKIAYCYPLISSYCSSFLAKA
ncbi:uncharacterized protein TNCV_75131 [Trichonephila clavipes]|nr:uncharacterized protein TNCV_75131 [Trichonephila clavipes]